MKPHGQRCLAAYSPWGHKSLGNEWVTKQQQEGGLDVCSRVTQECVRPEISLRRGESMCASVMSDSVRPYGL